MKFLQQIAQNQTNVDMWWIYNAIEQTQMSDITRNSLKTGPMSFYTKTFSSWSVLPILHLSTLSAILIKIVKVLVSWQNNNLKTHLGTIQTLMTTKKIIATYCTIV